jgi:hypothetical protein
VICLGASARHATFPEVTGSRSSRPRPVVPELLEQIGFTDHALTRFAGRAGMATSSRALVEPIVRDLLLQEGLVVGARPHWAHSRNTADLYLQLGEWMLFIGCRQEQPGTPYAIVTVVNGPEENTWRTALRRGYIFTPPPPSISPSGASKPGLLATLARSVRLGRHERARARARRRHQQRYRVP